MGVSEGESIGDDDGLFVGVVDGNKDGLAVVGDNVGLAVGLRDVERERHLGCVFQVHLRDGSNAAQVVSFNAVLH